MGGYPWETFQVIEHRAHAAAVVEALEAGMQEGRGAVRLDGEMVDEAMRRNALQTLARAAAVRSHDPTGGC